MIANAIKTGDWVFLQVICTCNKLMINHALEINNNLIVKISDSKGFQRDLSTV